MADHPLSLIGTSEIPLMGLYYDKVIPQKELPIRMVGFSHCFRVETGHGSHAKGLYRLHQFSKVELAIIGSEEQSDALHEELREIQEMLVTKLGLPFRFDFLAHYFRDVLIPVAGKEF